MFFLFWVHVGACGLCWVPRRFSAERRHQTAVGCCFCYASDSTARAVYTGRAAWLVPSAGARPLQQQLVSGRQNVGVACLRVKAGGAGRAGASEEHGEPFQRPWAWSHAAVFVSLVASASTISTLGAFHDLCIVLGAPTFQCQKTSLNRPWVLLLRCFLFDGTCCVCGSRGPAGPSAGARPLKRQQLVSGRQDVGVACLRWTVGWCLSCAGASDEYDEPFQPP